MPNRSSNHTRKQASNSKPKKSSESFVDLSTFKIEKREVVVNGEQLPLAIGDKLLVNEQDHLVKTVVSIQVHEDGRIGYMLEWFDADNSMFKTEWVTSTELTFLNQAKKERKIVKAFAQEY